MSVPVGMDGPIVMAMVTGRDRVEVDAGGVDGGLRLGSITFRIVAR